MPVPDLGGRTIAISSVLLTARDGNAVTRVFSPGDSIAYDCRIFGARLDQASGKPKIEIEVHLFRGPERIFAGHPIPLPAASAQSPVPATGEIKIQDFLPPGDYAVELIAWDRAAGEKRHATQWSEFTLAAANKSEVQ